MEEARLKSGTAVQNCVRALSKGYSQFVHTEATLIPDDPSRGRGSIDITFDRTNSADFPVLTCDADIMKGFGIPHGHFDPNFVTFAFQEDGMVLRVSEERYGFTFVGIRRK